MPRLRGEALWARFRRRFRGVLRGVADAPDGGCLPDVGEGIVVALLLIAAALVLVFLVIPFLVALLDVLLVLLLALAGVVGRVVFRRPWTVEATSDDGRTVRWREVGWRASGVRRDGLAQLLEAGLVPASEVA